MGPNPPSTNFRRLTILLFMAQIAFGLGILLILPPLEGLDEVAHYSRIKSEAFYPSTPDHITENGDYAGQYIDREVYDYYHRAPMPIAWIHFPPMHKNDPDTSFMTYAEFFSAPAAVKAYTSLYRSIPVQASYQPTPMHNWEYQHPGLYYRLMAYAMRLLAGQWAFLPLLLVLRLGSFALAMAGFSIGVWGTARHARKRGWVHADKITVLGMLYPFLMPEFFWEFARLGNDSMCLFFFGIAWSMVLWILREPREDGWIYLGLSLALGCMTKALMLPVAAGFFFFLALQAFRSPAGKSPALRFWQQPALKTLLLFFFITAPTYAMNNDAGAGEFAQILHKENALQLLRAGFSWQALGLGLQEILQTFVWRSGTHSQLIIGLPIGWLFSAGTGLAAVAYLATLRSRKRDEALLPLCVILPVFAGLVAHLFVVMITGNSSTPGYYLHILAPAWAMMCGLGLHSGAERLGRTRLLVTGIAFLAFLSFVNAGAYMAYFSGCAVPVALSLSAFLLPAHSLLFCGSQPQMMIDHMAIVAWPLEGLIAFGIAALILGAAFHLSLLSAKRCP